MSRSDDATHEAMPLAELAVEQLAGAQDQTYSGMWQGSVTHDQAPRTDRQLTQTPGVLFCGGFHSSMRGNKAEYLRRLSAERGWAFTRFDYRGHGESPGKFADFSLHDWLDDTLAVLRSLPAPVVIVGSSMGAWLAVLAALREPDRVHALLTLAAAPDFTAELLWPGLSSDQQRRLSAGETVMLPSRYDLSRNDDGSQADGWPLNKRLFDSGRALSLLNETASALRCPLHLIHGTADTDVPMSHSQRLFELAGSTDASLLLLKGADHRLSDPASLARIGQTLHGLMTTVPIAPEPAVDTPRRPYSEPKLPEAG